MTEKPAAPDLHERAGTLRRLCGTTRWSAQGLAHASGWVSIVECDLLLVSGDVALTAGLPSSAVLRNDKARRMGKGQVLMIGSVAEQNLRAPAR